MILVTVGMQLGFDRLIEAMDKLAQDLDMEIVAQIGKGAYLPKNMEARVSIAPVEFEELIERSRLIVSHAGIGTVLTAQRFRKPILLFPRRFHHGEHRNNHQVATAQHLQGRQGLLVAMDETQLQLRIAEGLALTSAEAEMSPTADQLHRAISEFIEGRSL